MVSSNNLNAVDSNKYWVNSTSNAENSKIVTNPQEKPINSNICDLKTEFAQEKKKNGLIEKFYNFCKNATGLGLGTDKIDKQIDAFEKGNVTEKEVRNKISDYRVSQENAAQNFGDMASGAVAITTYFGLDKGFKHLKAMSDINIFSALKLFEKSKNVEAKFKGFINSNTKKHAVMLPVVMLLGGMTKWLLLKFNRRNSREFKVNNAKDMNKKELAKTKIELNKQRHKQNAKNFLSGAINGLLSPVLALAGGIVGVPAYILATSGTRFWAGKNDNKEKSFDGYFNSLTNNAVLNSLFVAAVAVPAFKKAKYNKVLGENLVKVVDKFKEPLKEYDFKSVKTALAELEETIFASPKIKNILFKYDVDASQRADMLIKENIFAAKFKQISTSKDNLTQALKSKCPPSRTMSDAQNEINRLLDSTKYSVTKLLGVGTIAETYLAKDASGKEVCIKILKNGINLEKIQRDKEAFINMVLNGVPKDKLTESQKYLIRNIENLADAYLKEIDFVHEMEAAKKLSKYTKVANVVKPIEAKPGVYVMERAPGIGLDDMVEYFEYEEIIKAFKKALKSGEMRAEDADMGIAVFTEKIQKLKEKTPDFKDFELSDDEIKLLLEKYMSVRVEQFNKIDKLGKTLHADIHPGNIFIDIEALKSKKGKIFTLIDTGNTIDLSKEHATASLKLDSYKNYGNTKDITKYFMEGAILPKGKTKEEAFEQVEGILKELFFEKEYRIDTMNTDTLSDLMNKILRKCNIIPSDSQLALKKAGESADRSFSELVNAFINRKYLEDIKDIDSKSKFEKIKIGANMAKDASEMFSKFQKAKNLQSLKNMTQRSPREIYNMFRNPNNLKTNSEEYLTYYYKQKKNWDIESQLAEAVIEK